LDVSAARSLLANYVVITVKDARGNRVTPSSILINPGPLTTNDYKVVKSGEHVVIKIGDLLDKNNFRFWDLKAGKYVLSARVCNRCVLVGGETQFIESAPRRIEVRRTKNAK
jgi:hypothetical protein